MPNGNKIERTLYANALVEGEPATFAFRSTAFPIGQAFAKQAEKIVAKIDGRDFLVVGAKYQVGSRMEGNALGRWFLPTFKFLGKLGEPSGPTLAEARRARDLRIGLKTEAAALAAQSPLAAKLEAISTRAPAIEPPRPRGNMTITSGKQEQSPPIETYDGPNDSLDDINF
jgi:hypothetical protein